MRTNVDNAFRIIRSGAVTFAGHRGLMIYGKLSCTSGKRMLKKNRVFFADEAEAIDLGYRPCGACMVASYRIWRGT